MSHLCPVKCEEMQGQSGREGARTHLSWRGVQVTMPLLALPAPVPNPMSAQPDMDLRP